MSVESVQSLHTWWGADCADDFRKVATTFAAHYGHLPTFVGRYLSAFKPTTAEIVALHAQRVGLLLIWNGASASDVTQGFTSGTWHGQAAVRSAHLMGCPPGRFLPFDCEAGWRPTPEFIAGYLDAVAKGGYVGGAYLNAQDPQHTGAWIAARALSKSPGYIYSSEPEPYAIWDMVDPAWYDFSRTPLGAAHAADVILHQYGEGELNGRVDLDVATDLGYSLLWTPPIVAAAKYKAKNAVDLKQAPNHVCPSALDGIRAPAKLVVGEPLQATGRRTPHWLEVRIPLTTIHGWVQLSDVEPA